MTRLTRKQQQILDFIQGWQQTEGVAPTYREIAERFGYLSPNSVTTHVRLLRQKGCLESGSGKSRSLRVAGAVRRRVANIPVLGAIPAGFPRDGEQEPEGCVSVDIKTIGFTPTRNTFAAHVRGDSMIGRHIVDGDIVILERGSDPRNGQIVAALIDGERTLKTFVSEGGKTFLKSENPKYPKLFPAEELVIQGVFRALIRRAKE